MVMPVMLVPVWQYWASVHFDEVDDDERECEELEEPADDVSRTYMFT